TFAQLTGVQFVYNADLAKGVMSQGAAAGQSVEQTLHDLLRGTGLTFEFVNDRTVTVTPATAGAGPRAANPVSAQTRSSDALSGTSESTRSGMDRFRLAQAKQDSSTASGANADKRSVQSVEEIVVTGSRLTTAATEGAQDVRTYSREVIARSGQ